MLGGSETCFGISLDPKMTAWEEKKSRSPYIETFVNLLFRSIFVN